MSSLFIAGDLDCHSSFLSFRAKIGHRITGDRKGPSNSRGSAGNIRTGDLGPLPRGLLRDPGPGKTWFLPAIPVQRATLLSGSWRQGSARHEGQRRQLPIAPYSKALRLLKINHLRTKPSQNKRQGRALRPNLIARLGLRSRLPDIQPDSPHLPQSLPRHNWHRPHRSLSPKHRSPLWPERGQPV